MPKENNPPVLYLAPPCFEASPDGRTWAAHDVFDTCECGSKPARYVLSNDPLPGVTLQVDRANRLYLAGPMTGLEDFNFPAFNKMAAELRGRGYVVENPAEHGVVAGADWADYMAYDLTRLGLCGQVALLPGWENSQGASLEVLIAHRLGMTVVNAHDLVSMEIAG
ncbi:DUF4406 domain-containing protein [Pseudomonas sp. FSL W5-0203]|uniref:DUF4406 domain-containing protein n=1 Tax=Pseudomonas sp. FSL W5-0203 TaxID=1920491 RepID=UPI000A82CBCD|nr:DUF4406 domain-containing protein [Pseudomonas sp. FSL W5-0203]